MIATNELRYGSKVLWEGNIYTIISLGRGYVSIDRGLIPTLQSPHMTANDLQPIPLTPEMLINNGCIKEWTTGSIKKWFYIHVDSGIKLYGFDDNPNKYQFGFQDVYAPYNTAFIHTIEYVHQFQNLVFTLTQTELTINL